MPRLFVGLELPEPVTTRLSLLRAGLPGARWIDPSDYHITLRFIGDIDRRMARDIEDELADIGREALEVKISGLDVFGGDKPHTLYAVINPSRPLITLQAESERCLHRLGLKPEVRKFTPHITLARLRASVNVLDVADYLTAYGALARHDSPKPALASQGSASFGTEAVGETFIAERFALFSAREPHGGGPYIVEAAYPLF